MQTQERTRVRQAGAGAAEQARDTAASTAQSRWFQMLTRAGFVARALIYGLIGVLALELALGSGGKATNQRGAIATVADQPFGKLLVVLLAIGFGAYALWRFVQASLGHGPEGGSDPSAGKRLAAAGSGVVYAALCLTAISVLTGSGSSGSGSPHRATAGVLGWPGGQWIVGLVGLGFIVVAAYQAYRGVTQRFLEEDKTEDMSPAVRRSIGRVGMVGHVGRSAVFGLVGLFAIEAAIDYDPNQATGLDGALSRLQQHGYGSVLLGVVAAGLVAFGLFSLAEARYRKL